MDNFGPTILELRRYRMHPGRRDAFLEIFEHALLDPLEDAGMRVLGQFRDADDSDLCVWMRDFADMAQRRRSLEAFYGSDLWWAHRDGVNATLIDSDDVFLLHPAWPGAGLARSARTAADARHAPPGCLLATVWCRSNPGIATRLADGSGAMHASLQAAGALATGWYVQETAPNDFPRLPVRTGEHALACFAVFPDLAGARTRADAASAALRAGGIDVPGAPIRHFLLPSARSALHA